MSDEWYKAGKIYRFYGVDGNFFKLNDSVFEAVEDESDGYRSYLETVRAAAPEGVFSRATLAYVKVTEVKTEGSIDPHAYPFEGYLLTDGHGHVWLRVGTEDYDDYYPTFIFEYTPKAVTT